MSCLVFAISHSFLPRERRNRRIVTSAVGYRGPCLCAVRLLRHLKKKKEKKRMRTERKSNISVRGDVETHPRLKIEIKKKDKKEKKVAGSHGEKALASF